MEWFRLMSEHVSLNKIGNVTTSTVLLYKKYESDEDVYETCVFEDDDSTVIGMYSTVDDAIAGHNRIIKEQLMRL